MDGGRAVDIVRCAWGRPAVVRPAPRRAPRARRGGDGGGVGGAALYGQRPCVMLNCMFPLVCPGMAVCVGQLSG